MASWVRLAQVFWLAWVSSVQAADAQSDSRLALVIGNAAYESSPLKNPVNDARAVGRALQDLGFEVLLRENLSQKQFIAVLREFGDRLRDKGGVGLFYYAGHGVQVKGANYLLPIDARIDSEDEVRYQAIDANQVLEKLAEAQNQFNLVILDACRDNPFARSFRSKQTGLAQMDAPSGTLIAFATAPGAVAYDGSGVNGVYTKHLLRNLTIPGLPVELVLKRVREGVSKETSQKQIPWESSSLLGEFYFKVAAPGSAPVNQAENTAVEIAFWESVKNSNVTTEYQAYLDKYPRGQFATLARARLDTLLAQAPGPGRKQVGPPVQVALAQPGSIATRPNDLVKVGDQFTYHLMQGGWAKRKIGVLNATITAVDGDNVKERLTMEGFPAFKPERTFKIGFDPNAGFQEVQLPGAYFFAEFSPYVDAAGIPIPGRQWKDIPATLNIGNQAIDRANSRMVVQTVSEERVKVPAGEFMTVRVEAEGALHSGAIPGGYRSIRLTYWYSPEMRRTVKIVREIKAHTAPGSIEGLELASVRR